MLALLSTLSHWRKMKKVCNKVWGFRLSILWITYDSITDHKDVGFQADHTLDHLWFQADLGKIIVRKVVWFIRCNWTVRLWFVSVTGKSGLQSDFSRESKPKLTWSDDTHLQLRLQFAENWNVFWSPTKYVQKLFEVRLWIWKKKLLHGTIFVSLITGRLFDSFVPCASFIMILRMPTNFVQHL